VLDAQKVRLFRERLAQAGEIDGLFNRIDVIHTGSPPMLGQSPLQIRAEDFKIHSWKNSSSGSPGPLSRASRSSVSKKPGPLHDSYSNQTRKNKITEKASKP